MTLLLVALALLAGAGLAWGFTERARRIHAERLSGTYLGVAPKPKEPEPPAEERALAAAKRDAEAETVERLKQGGFSEKEARRMIRVAEGFAE